MAPVIESLIKSIFRLNLGVDDLKYKFFGKKFETLKHTIQFTKHRRRTCS